MAAPKETSTDTDSPYGSGIETATRVKSVLEVRGEVRLNSNRTQNEPVRRAEVESKTTLQYEERFATTNDFAQSVMYFKIAEASNTVEKPCNGCEAARCLTNDAALVHRR